MVIQLDVIIFCRNYCYHTFSDNKVADIFSTHIFKATSQERFKYYSFFALQTYLTQNLSLIQKNSYNYNERLNIVREMLLTKSSLII